MRSLGLYLLLVVILGVLFCLQQFVSTEPFAEAQVSTLSVLQEKQLELYREENTLLTTLATAAIGGIGVFALQRYAQGSLPTSQRIRALLGALFACASLYFAYLSHETVIWMLQSGFFNIMSPRIVWGARLQFWSFIVSLLFVADFFYNGL